MVVSVDTAKQLAEAIARNVPRERIMPLVRELKQISGNKSFTDTIERVSKLLADYS